MVEICTFEHGAWPKNQVLCTRTETPTGSKQRLGISQLVVTTAILTTFLRTAKNPRSPWTTKPRQKRFGFSAFSELQSQKHFEHEV